jgi:hypothetical protein
MRLQCVIYPLYLSYCKGLQTYRNSITGAGDLVVQRLNMKKEKELAYRDTLRSE